MDASLRESDLANGFWHPGLEPEGRQVAVPHGQAVVECKDTGSVYPQLVSFTFDAGRERNLSAETLLVRDAMSFVCRLCSRSL